MFYAINIYKWESFESHLVTYAKKYQYIKIASHFKEVMLRDFAHQPYDLYLQLTIFVCTHI